MFVIMTDIPFLLPLFYLALLFLFLDCQPLVVKHATTQKSQNQPKTAKSTQNQSQPLKTTQKIPKTTNKNSHNHPKPVKNHLIPFTSTQNHPQAPKTTKNQPKPPPNKPKPSTTTYNQPKLCTKV